MPEQIVKVIKIFKSIFIKFGSINLQTPNDPKTITDMARAFPKYPKSTANIIKYASLPSKATNLYIISKPFLLIFCCINYFTSLIFSNDSCFDFKELKTPFNFNNSSLVPSSTIFPSFKT